MSEVNPAYLEKEAYRQKRADELIECLNEQLKRKKIGVIEHRIDNFNRKVFLTFERLFNKHHHSQQMRNHFTLYLLVIGLCVACNNRSKEPAPISKEVVLTGLNDSLWTYYSLEDGGFIGTSRFLSEEEDQEWADRTDWDFAICGDYLKTNSGSSGKGKGGLQLDTIHHFLQIHQAPVEGYQIDERNQVK